MRLTARARQDIIKSILIAITHTEEMYLMTTDTVKKNDPYEAFDKMTDEDIVLDAQLHDNVLA